MDPSFPPGAPAQDPPPADAFAAGAAASSTSSLHAHDDDDQPASKRSRISVACDTCRRKKVKCNGGQPCDYCARVNFPCTYQAPKRRGNTGRSGSANAGASSSTSAAGGADGDGPSGDDSMQGTGHDGQGGGGGGDDDDDEELADMMTFLVSLEENGGINALRSLGSSSGMHLLRMWSDRVSEGVLVVPSVLKKHTPRGPETDLPPPEIIELLLDFFFEYLHPFMPITERQMIYNSLSQPNPPLMLLNSIFAISSRVYEGLSPDRTDKPGASDIFLNRTRQIARNILLEPPCLEYIQAMLLLSFHEMGFLRGSTWLLSGVAIRMAQDIGLNRRMDNLTGALSISPLQRHLMKKTWTAVFIMDRFVCAVLGRPLAIHEEDCDVEWPSPEDERELSGEDGTKLLGDYVELAKLSAILGKILRNINSVRNHTPGRLSFSLPEIHTALSQWLNQLPPTLRYSFNPKAPIPSRFAAFLNALYYTCIILLYRPFISSAKARSSPLFPQYLHICSTAAQAIVHICHARVDEFFLLPNVILYCLFTAITTLVITLNCMAHPPSAAATTAQQQQQAGSGTPPSTSHTRANSLTALMKCLVVLSTLQEIWPMANRIGFMLEDFFSAHKIPIPNEAKRCQPTAPRKPARAEQCSNPTLVDEAYSRLREAAADSRMASNSPGGSSSGKLNGKSPSPGAFGLPRTPGTPSSAFGQQQPMSPIHGMGQGLSTSPLVGASGASGSSSSGGASCMPTTGSASGIPDQNPLCNVSLPDGIRVDKAKLTEAAIASGHPADSLAGLPNLPSPPPTTKIHQHQHQQQQQPRQSQPQQQSFSFNPTAPGSSSAPLPPSLANNIYINAGFLPPPGFQTFGTADGLGFDFADLGMMNSPPTMGMRATPSTADASPLSSNMFTQPPQHQHGPAPAAAAGSTAGSAGYWQQQQQPTMGMPTFGANVNGLGLGQGAAGAFMSGGNPLMTALNPAAMFQQPATSSAGMFGQQQQQQQQQQQPPRPPTVDPLFSGGDPIANLATPSSFMGATSSMAGGIPSAASMFGQPQQQRQAGQQQAQPQQQQQQQQQFPGMELEEMMGVQPSMSFGGLGLDLDAFMFGGGSSGESR